MYLQARFRCLRSCCRYSSFLFGNEKIRFMYTQQGTISPKILITGGLGQLGVDCAKLLRQKYGTENVILSDIVKPDENVKNSGPFIFADILDPHALKHVVIDHNIRWIIHFAAVLSAMGEQNILEAIKVNIEGLHNVMNLSLQYNLRIFVPSSIGAFGEDAPLHLVPNDAIQRPRTIYGVAKVHAELLGEYYFYRYGVDFRCLRFPGVISRGLPGGGTTDYAIDIFNAAITKASYECYLKPDTVLPMIYIDDCLRAVAKFISIPECMLPRRTYNIAAMSFSPEDMAKEIRKYIPNFEMRYNPDFRQQIADTWPKVLDDSKARQDWQWYSHFDLERLTKVMIDKSLERLDEENMARGCIYT